MRTGPSRALSVVADEVGHGPDVVLVPGLAVQRYLRATQRQLARRATVHLLAYPGTGEALDAPAYPTLADDVEAVAEWMHRREIRSTVLVGHSYGSQVATRLALRCASRVRALVLASPTVDPHFRSWTRLLRRWALDTTREPRGLTSFQRPEQRRAGLRRMATMVGAMLGDDVDAWLSTIDLPITFVRGERDALSTLEWVRSLADKGDRELVQVPKVAHAFPYDHPEALTGVVERVMDR